MSELYHSQCIPSPLLRRKTFFLWPLMASPLVWGCMGWNGVGHLAEVEGRMDADQYVSILEDHMLSSLEESGILKEEVIFQQNNDPKHTSKKAKKWMKDNNITLLDWPAQSPDLSPIEYQWVHHKRQLDQYPTAPKGVWEI